MKCFQLMSGVLCGIFFFSAIAVSLMAEPVTLRFDAEIGPRRPDSEPIELPFSFAEGDKLIGKFRFDPVDVPPETQAIEAAQPYEIEFTIDGFTFGTTGYLIAVGDDVVGDDIPVSFDDIRVRCSVGGPDVCGERLLAGPGSPEFFFSFRISGDVGVLEGADIPGDAAVWNNFDNQTSLSLAFQDQTTKEIDGLRAFNLTFTNVPEPATVWLLVLPLTLLLLRDIRPRP